MLVRPGLRFDPGRHLVVSVRLGVISDYYRRLADVVRTLLDTPGSARLSVTAAARSLHTTRRTLMTRFPAEYARLVARHQSYRTEARDELFALRREDLLEAVSACVSEGRYPSKRRVFAATGLSTTFQRASAAVREGLAGRASRARDPACVIPARVGLLLAVRCAMACLDSPCVRPAFLVRFLPIPVPRSALPLVGSVRPGTRYWRTSLR